MIEFVLFCAPAVIYVVVQSRRGDRSTAAAFVVPHLALLLIDAGLWPIVVIQFAAGYALGWLRHRTGTFVPGAIVHVVANLAAGLAAA